MICMEIAMKSCHQIFKYLKMKQRITYEGIKLLKPEIKGQISNGQVPKQMAS